MKRLLVLAGVALALLLGVASAARADLCASTDCGPYAASLHWDISWPGHTATGYYVFLTGVQEGDVSSSPWVLGGMDCGSAFTLGVEAHDNSGHTSSMYTSTYSTPSCATAPANTAEPVVTGTVATGDVLSTSTGTWTGTPTSYGYQWQDCATDGTACSNITGATGSTYTVAAGDAGHTIEADVTATNAAGSNTAGAPIVPLVDNFGGSSVDTNVWAVLNQQGDTSNSEIECYEPGQVAEGSNTLTETLKFISGGFTCPAGTPSSSNPLNYMSGAVQEIATNFTYGTVVVNASLAAPEGTTWPAIWLSGATCQTSSTSPFTFLSGTSGTPTGYYCPWSDDSQDAAEIDIAENLDSTATNEELWNNGAKHQCGPVLSVGTHTYELDWSSGSLTWKVDGTTECSTTASVPSHPMFLIIDTAVCSSGSGCSGSPVNADLPATTTVNYVHVSH